MTTSLSATELDIIAQSPFKRDFPLLAQHPELSFLDSAATAQRPAAVLDAQRRAYAYTVIGCAGPRRHPAAIQVKAFGADADASG
jgi:selenocysteine lyase/cysteine desulfurase